MADSSGWLHISDFSFIGSQEEKVYILNTKIVHGKLYFIPIPLFQLEWGFFCCCCGSKLTRQISMISVWEAYDSIPKNSNLIPLAEGYSTSAPLNPFSKKKKLTKNYSPNYACWFLLKGPSMIYLVVACIWKSLVSGEQGGGGKGGGMSKKNENPNVRTVGKPHE